MKLSKLFASALAASLLSVAAHSQLPIKTAVTANGLFAELYVPAGESKRRPAIIVMGGSGGGLEHDAAQLLANQGFVTLDLAYFGAPGLPPILGDVPLEYFDKGLAFLRAHSSVDASRIGVFGGSKGAEAALLVASRNPDVRAVVAVAPSMMSWQGIGEGASGVPGKGSWSLKGKSIPYLHYDRSAPFTTVGDMYARTFAKRALHPDAEIPVERINAPILLICGESDALWPSCPMSDAIVARLKSKGVRHNVQQEKYADAGHGLNGPPYTPTDPSAIDPWGGTNGGNARARADWWPKAIAFFQAELR
jgi:dienelactone hydrolase